MRGFLRLLEFNDVATFVCKGQLVAEPFPLANDGLCFGFALLVELVDILHGSPVGDVPHLALAKETIEHAAAGQEAISVSSPKMGLIIALSDGNYEALPYSQHRLVC